MHTLPNPYQLSILSEPSEIEAQLKSIADFRRYIFANAYGDLLIYPSTGETISPQEVFKTPKDEYVPIEVMDSLSESDLPVHPETGERAIIYRDQEKMQWLLQKQLIENEGVVALIKKREESEKENRIIAMTYGYRAKLKDIFDLEWSNKFIYAKSSYPEHERSWGNFLGQLNNLDVQNFHPESLIYCLNCFCVDLEMRGESILVRQPFFEYLSSRADFENQYVINDVIESSSVYRAMKRVGGKFIDNALNSNKKAGDEIISIADLKSFAALSFSYKPPLAPSKASFII